MKRPSSGTEIVAFGQTEKEAVALAMRWLLGAKTRVDECGD